MIRSKDIFLDMAQSFNLENMDEKIRLTANFDEKQYAYSLIRTSAFDDYQKEDIEHQLSDDITYDELDNIINILQMNQLSKMEGNYNQGDIKNMLDLLGDD